MTEETKRFLQPADGPILEGGCGDGKHVVALVKNGFHCIGVDYAADTVQRLQIAMPAIDFRLGDVRNLHFDDGYFAGYWSLGVIEHSWKGYDEIAREMVRVLRPGGYLFLTFPHMSLLRRAKARLGGYAPWQGAGEAPKAFYQFALDHGQVIDRFMHLGFTLRRSRKIDGIKGLKDEIDLLKPLLQPLYDYRGGCLLLKAGRYVLDRMLASWTGHVMILVLRKAVD